MTAHNLTQQSTSFIGRTTELAEIAHRLTNPTCRLLTLVGPGGIGKTRLALQATVDQDANFGDGVYFVGLASVGSTHLLPSAIAGSLAVSYGAEDLAVQIINYLRDKHLLLVLDNFEHLQDGAGLLVDLLEQAPRLKILVTSRERLNIQEEWVLAIDGLAFPKDDTPDQIDTFAAVQLFVQRAYQVQAKFSLSENVSFVSAICQQVEGVPLGIELAATWLRAMSCRQIAAEIAGNRNFLTTPLHNVPERHRSLQTVFEQSWRLLEAREQEALMRLSVFRGSFDREAAEQVAGASLPLLAGLIDKSLIRLNPAGRYDIHELLRQYAADKLSDAGEANVTIQRHVSYFLKLAEGAEAHKFGREQIAWFDRLVTEFDNLRAALDHSVKNENGLRFGGALGWFFSERCYWNEGRDWLERILDANQDAPGSLRIKVLLGAGALAGLVGNKVRVRALCEEALNLARALKDRRNSGWALSHLGLFLHDNQSTARLEESLALFRELDDPMGISHTLVRRAWNAIDEQRDYPYACSLLHEASIIAHDAGDTIINAWVAYTLGRVSWLQKNDLLQAKTHLETSLLFFREARFQVSTVFTLLAGIERAMGNLVRAQMLYGECIIIEDGISPNHAFVLAGLADVAIARQQFERAATLLGAVDDGAIRAVVNPNDWPELISYDSNIAKVRAQLGEAAFAEMWAVGKAMSHEQIVAYALEGSVTLPEVLLADRADVSDMIQRGQATEKPLLEPLSERELEVLALVATGFSNREIAEELVLATSTVKWYVSEILSKLGVANRTQAVVHARQLDLLA